jgi:hypothetical protein
MPTPLFAAIFSSVSPAAMVTCFAVPVPGLGAAEGEGADGGDPVAEEAGGVRDADAEAGGGGGDDAADGEAEAAGGDADPAGGDAEAEVATEVTSVVGAGARGASETLLLLGAQRRWICGCT